MLCNSWVFFYSAAGGGDGNSHWGNICGWWRYFKGNLPQWTCHTNRNNVSMKMLFALLQIWPVTYLLNGIKYFFLLILGRWFKNSACFVLDRHIFSENMMHFIEFLLLTTIRKVKMSCSPLISRKTATYMSKNYSCLHLSQITTISLYTYEFILGLILISRLELHPATEENANMSFLLHLWVFYYIQTVTESDRFCNK